MQRYLKPIVPVMLALATVACVSQTERDKLNTLYRKSQEQIVDLQAQLDEKDAQLAALRDSANVEATLFQQLEDVQADNARLASALAAMEARLREAAGITILPGELDTALHDLAAANPQLMSYDSKLGMVKFSSDLTFRLGSTSINSAAAAGLNKLATILSSSAARSYEVRIVGHTDNVPIKRVRAQHPTNWHLSVHRAIAVKDVLKNAGITPPRIGVAGYGEFRPVVPNGPKGAQANRRVEIYLVPMPTDLSAAQSAAASPDATPEPSEALK